MREALGSWLSGPTIISDRTIGISYRGENLGLPVSGPGAVAGNGRRFLALCIDWFACLGLCLLIWNRSSALGAETLLVWWALCSLSVWFMSRTPGQLICGIYVAILNFQPMSTDDSWQETEQDVRGSRGIALHKALIRQSLLLPLLIPAFSQDENGRGLHDRATATIILCS